MKIPGELRKTIAFIAYENQQTGTVDPVGTVFFLGYDPPPGTSSASRVFAVTARHVIDGLKGKGCCKCVLRLNSVKKEDGIESIEVPLENWIFHPSDKGLDVAVYERGIPSNIDQKVLPISLGATQERLVSNEVDLGDEVFISGLFTHHYGNERNIPIVRVGNLAALDGERVSTQSGPIEAYLVEARSTGGMSGSPVFVNLGNIRPKKHGLEVSSGDPKILLLGLIHGHYKVDAEESPLFDDVKGHKAKIIAEINSGIAIVVPFYRILEVVEYAKRRGDDKSNL
jgi:hypothetical protein